MCVEGSAPSWSPRPCSAGLLALPVAREPWGQEWGAVRETAGDGRAWGCRALPHSAGTPGHPCAERAPEQQTRPPPGTQETEISPTPHPHRGRARGRTLKRRQQLGCGELALSGGCCGCFSGGPENSEGGGCGHGRHERARGVPPRALHLGKPAIPGLRPAHCVWHSGECGVTRRTLSPMENRGPEQKVPGPMPAIRPSN